MGYDHELADRIRELIAGDQHITEQRMFGNLAFLINGNMAVAASGQGGLLVRVNSGWPAGKSLASMPTSHTRPRSLYPGRSPPRKK